MLCTIETFDMATRQSRVVLRSEALLEAPNWARDGALIVNGEGLLHRLAEDGLSVIDTGDCDLLNNDHGLSPDGAWLAISDKTETGKSCIYVLPADGGTPRRVTQGVPSWFHGWSPDGARLAYTAVRDGQFAICTCPVAGGEETRVVTSAHHYDGPDYTPDGQWIWFNSERGGPASDLWRVRPDGSDLQQMTRGERVEWFPHPSPCGRHVLYLSYPEGTEGHPFGRHVELRLMPAGGGAPETLVNLYGGQGTINVPCWAPDGSAFAYVRYTEPQESPCPV
ncbi:TolB family protein [Sagittula salina]|uniref:TolB family protein n=1 Tax=Sagittula salina TaxID=2820268 RepID=A0A940S091_9RHOB|nr:PD40 domain-containing protein [Sagittula salina]MBP0482808.1 TolB family protein [Sagittula salina]